MKRLLVYMIAVLGLGLTFSVSANSVAVLDKYSYDKDFICFEDVGNGTIFVGTSKSGWVTQTSNVESLCSIFIYEDKHSKKYKEITDKWPYLLKNNLGNHKIPVAEQYLKKWKLKDKKFSKVRHKKILIFKEKTQIVKNEPSIKKKIVKKSNTDWRKNLAVEGTETKKNTNTPKKNINKILNKNDFTFYAFEYPNSNTIGSIYGTSTYNTSEAILLLENGECKFGSSLDKLIENSKYDTSYDFKCSYRVRDNNIHARIQDRINISIYPKEMKVLAINSIGKTISRVADPNEVLYIAKNYQVSKLINQITGNESKTKIAKAKPSKSKNKETINYSNGGKYIGETQYGQRHGYGTYIWDNGDEYVGDFKNNKLDGIGTFIFANNGNKYIGNFKNNKFNGNGEFVFANGDKTVGEFNDGKLIDGPAYSIYSDTGDILIATYKDNKIADGEAELYNSSGKYITTRVFKNGRLVDNKNYWIKKRKKTLAQALEENNLKITLAQALELKIEDTQTQIVKKEKITTPKKKVKVAEVEESEQEEFKPENKDIDNDAPVIQIAQNITVNDTSYVIEGKVSDKSDKIFVEIDGQPIEVKKGKFKVNRYSPVDEQIKIVAIDQWGNKSQPKIVNIKIDIDETVVAENLEPLDPSNIRTKVSNDKVAIIIGIEDYTEAPKANYANLDAQYFFDYARKAFGVKKQNINLLINEDATVVKTDKALSLWLKSKIKKNRSDLIIFFAGHGLASTDGEELYLLPHDGNPDRLERTALSRTDLFKEIIALNPKSVTMFLDTCYSGVSRDEQMLLASARPINIVAKEQKGIPDNFTIFSASQLTQISSGLKEINHGIFSYYLMKGLEGYADVNEDKKITNGELLAYMDENVSQKAAEQGREQNPSLIGDRNKILISFK